MPTRIVRASFYVVLIAVGVPNGAWAQSQEPAGDYGDPRRLVLDGTPTFGQSDIKSALLGDYDVLMAAHPSAPLAEYVDVLKQKLLAGYRHEGFPEAKVEVRINRDVIRVEINVEEGRRCLAGEVRIVGANGIDVDVLKKMLTEPSPPEGAMPVLTAGSGDHAGKTWIDKYGNPIEFEQPVWKPGKPAPFDRPTRNKLRGQIKRAFAGQGRFSPKFDVDVAAEPDGKTASLVVKVAEEGPAAIVGRIEISGLQKNSREDVLDYLKLTPGQALTSETCARIRDRLWRCGRFLNSQVKPIEPSAGVKEVTLQIELTEYKKAPPLSQELSAEEKILLKLRDWLADPKRWQADMVIDARPFGQGMLWVFSPGKGDLFEFGRSQDAGDDTLPKLAFVVSPETVGLYVPSCRYKLAGKPARAQLIANVVLAAVKEPEDPEKPFALSFGLGFRTPPKGQIAEPFCLDVRLDPSAFLSIIHQGKADCRLHDGVLEVTDPRGEHWQIDAASGRLLEHALLDERGQLLLQISFVRGEFKRRVSRIHTAAADYRDAFDPQRPLSSSLEVLCDDRLISAFVELAPQQRQTLAAVRGMFQRGMLEPVDQLVLASYADGDSEFTIPFHLLAGHDPSKLNPMALMMRVALPLYGRLFPHDSWPWTLGREAAFVATGNSKYADAELKKLYASEQAGPIAFLAAARLLEMVNPNFARGFAAKGLQKLSAGDFRKDYRILLHGDGIAGKCLCRAAEMLRDLDGKQVALLGKSLLGEHGPLLGRSAEILRRHRDRPIAEALPEVLDDLWEQGMSQFVRISLRELQERTGPEAIKVTQAYRR